MELSNGGSGMTEKRFINDIDDGKLIDTKGELSTIHYSDKVDFYELWEFLNKLNDENEQLKQRNNRQYEQLGRLYDLIEQKEWRALTDIIDDFKKSDEQLQKEWMIYGDVE